MKKEVKVPSVGESITTGVIVSWLKHNGDQVREGENIFELETDKAVLEIPSPGAGTLEILVQEATEVEIGQTVALLAPARQASEPSVEEAGEASAEAPGAAGSAAQAQQKSPAATADAGSSSPALSPAVRRIVAEHKLEAERIEGTGRGGRITKQDVLRAVEQQQRAGIAPQTAPSKPTPPSAATPQQAAVGSQRKPAGQRRSERVPMSRIRARTAARLVSARQTTAYLTTFNEIDMQKVIEIRTQYKEQFQKEHGIRIGFMSFFVKACCQTLKEFPAVNTEVDGQTIIYKYFYDIGMAISIDEGLVVPVIRDADQKHFAEIEAAIADLAQRAKQKKLLPDELTGGTFTITNGGVFGSLLSTPLPAYPQTAILGMHAIKKRPVVIDDKIIVRPMMYVALTYDHRVIDGREAIGFLARVKDFIEDPDKLLLEL